MKKIINIAIFGLLATINNFGYENVYGTIVEVDGCLYQCIDDVVGWEKQVGAALIFPPTDYVYPSEIVIPDSVVIDNVKYPVIYIRNGAFFNHPEVRKVIFGKNILHGPGAFDSSNVEDVIFNDKLTRIGQHAFYSCANLKKIELHDNYIELGDLAFVKSGLTEIIIKGKVGYLTNSLFCNNVTSLRFGDNATGIIDGSYIGGLYLPKVSELNFPGSIIIKSNNYRGVPNLKKITLRTITDNRSRMVIEGGSFYVDAPLEEFVSMDSEPPLVADNMLSEAQFATCVLRVPEGCIDAYKAAQGWRNFANIAEMASAPDTEISAPTVVSSEYYDMIGRRVAAPKPGSLYIEHSRMSDGSVKNIKIVR